MDPIFAAAVLTFAVGCSTVTPASFSAKAPAVSVAWPGPLSVRAAHRDDPISRFNANGTAFEANLDRFSDELARLLRDSLEKAGTKTTGGDKTLELQVIYLDFMFQGPCLLDYTVRLGNGEVFGAQSTGDSSNFAWGCRTALESAVTQIVGDSRTVAYAGGQ
jgi:hypothetical protein